VRHYFIVRCPKCGYHTYYSPRGKAKRRRRRCPYCGYRYSVKNKTIIGGPVDEKEVSFIIKKLNLENSQGDRKPTNDQLRPMFQKIRADFKKIVSEGPSKAFRDDNNFDEELFFLKRPNGYRGNPPRPKAQGGVADGGEWGPSDIGVEIDRTHFSGRFEGPDVFIKLGGDPLKGVYEKKLGFGTLYIWSTGVFDAYIDLSDPVNRRLLIGVLKAIEVETGCKVKEIEYIDGEATVEVPRYDALGEKIANTVGPRTKLMWIDYIPKLKLYLDKGEPIPFYRIEASNFEPLYKTIYHITREKLHIEKSMPVFLIVSDVNEQQLLQIQQQVEQIHEENRAITEALNQLAVLVMHHDERMIEEHNLIIQQNREILEKMEQIAAASSNIEQEILNTIQDGPKTVAEIASLLNMPYHTVYYHIRNLVARGSIRYEIQRSGRRGRPRKIYFIRHT